MRTSVAEVPEASEGGGVLHGRQLDPARDKFHGKHTVNGAFLLARQPKQPQPPCLQKPFLPSSCIFSGNPCSYLTTWK
jgi:hypothetical protein